MKVTAIFNSAIVLSFIFVSVISKSDNIISCGGEKHICPEKFFIRISSNESDMISDQEEDQWIQLQDELKNDARIIHAVMAREYKEVVEIES